MSDLLKNSGMRPKIGQSFITLPVTFDYSGGRRESNKSTIMWSIIIGVLGAIIGVGVIFNKEGFFLTNLLIGMSIMFFVSLIIRFGMLKEAKIRREYIEMKDRDFKQDFQKIWGIYAIDEQYPYYCRFRNGKSGLFIRLNKDVILGKYSESEFEHYEAIGDAYNLAGASRVQICHLDYMDNIGTDERLEDSFASLADVSNPDLKEVLTDIFTYQQEQMMERVTTFDAYLFLWTGSDINAWSTIQRILSCFLEANYRSYHIMNSSDLRDLAKVLLNLHDFSVLDAMLNAFNTTGYNGVVPIELVKANGEYVKLGKTIEEKKEEQRLKEKEQEIKKQEIKRRKGKKKKKELDVEEEIDLF